MRFCCGVIVPLQALCGGSCLILGLWIQMPALDLVFLELLCLLSMTAVLVDREAVGKWALAIAWGCSVLGLAHVFTSRSASYAWDDYFSIPPFLIAFELFLVSVGMPQTRLQRHWRLLGMLWALFAASIWLAGAYIQNLRLSFHLGLIILAGLLILLKRVISLSWAWIQVVNTILLLTIAVPCADWVLRPRFRFDPQPDPNKRAYLYDNAMRDPGAYAAWRQYALTETVRFAEEYYVPDPSGLQPFRLRSNRTRSLLQERFKHQQPGLPR